MNLKIRSQQGFNVTRMYSWLLCFVPVLFQCTDNRPSVIANYVFHLAKTFNSFYAEHSVTNTESEEKKILRLHIAVMTATVIKSGLQLLGISAPERM
ncbi:MAG: DALR anticodon-binding domain-containing protein [Ginsengibacter sp.]